MMLLLGVAAVRRRLRPSSSSSSSRRWLSESSSSSSSSPLSDDELLLPSRPGVSHKPSSTGDRLDARRQLGGGDSGWDESLSFRRRYLPQHEIREKGKVNPRIEEMASRRRQLARQRRKNEQPLATHLAEVVRKDTRSGGQPGAPPPRRFLDEYEIRLRSGRIAEVDRAVARRRRGESREDNNKNTAFETALAVEYDDEDVLRGGEKSRWSRHNKKTQQQPVEVVTLPGSTVTVGRLAAALKAPVDEIVECLEGLGETYSRRKVVKHSVDAETAELVALELGREHIKLRFVEQKARKLTREESEALQRESSLEKLQKEAAALEESARGAGPKNTQRPVVDSEEWEKLEYRAPVVAVMGHVDHGKTTLLDALRGGDDKKEEAGGITQRLAAFQVDGVTFVDTPGHAAFASMRSSSAKALDVALVVVAADDGVKPQTLEALRLARERKAAIVFAMTKADKVVNDEQAAIERISEQLADAGFVTEAHGGDHPLVAVSAVESNEFFRYTGLDDLNATLAAQAEVLDLRTSREGFAEAIVMDSIADKHLGLCVDVMVLWGTLRAGSHVVVGEAFGRVRRLSLVVDEHKKSDSAERLVLPGAPARVAAGFQFAGHARKIDAGDTLLEVKDEKTARRLAAARAAYREAKAMTQQEKKISDEVLPEEEEEEVVHVPVVVKVESRGEVDAVASLLSTIPSSKVRIEAVGGVGVGSVGRHDIDVASTFGAPVYAWNVGMAGADVKDAARKLAVDVRRHKVIYSLLDDITAHAASKLPPVPTPKVLGKLEVLKVFELNNGDKVAGCRVLDGTLRKSDPIRHVRGGDVLRIDDKGAATLKHFKTDVTSVDKGTECGLGLHDAEISGDLQQGDLLEAFEVVQVAAEL